ncbi:MAG: ATP/GTP-binding protein [Candidatus Lokiarchaeota archaeon]|nr:ATP/GTP-binding protein [Candidatus Lokiarchaeota archaeon]
MTTILVLGPAGSGKTTLVKALCDYARLSRKYNDVRSCNLDPGSRDDFPWDVDVRSIVTVEKVMEEHGLGPNGAIVKAYGILAGHVEALFADLEHTHSDLAIIDAPGQLEPLIFSEVGNLLIDSIKKLFDDILAVFLLPGDLINTPSSFAFLLLTLTGLQLTIHAPLLHAVSKADLLLPATESYIGDGKALRERVLDATRGQLTEFASRAAEVVERLLPAMQLVKISITRDGITGIGDLLDLVDETRCSCGDLT